MKVILPGSYDPVTQGHLEIIRRAADEYDEVFAVAFVNPNKKYLFSLEEKVEMLKLATGDLSNVKVDFSEGFVVDYMREHGCELIVKGYRTDADLPWEAEQAKWNEERGFKTRLIKCKEGLEDISSTAVREAIAKGERKVLERMLPKSVYEYIINKSATLF